MRECSSRLTCLPPAERSISDLDDDILGVLDLRARTRLQGDLELAFENDGLHGGCWIVGVLLYWRTRTAGWVALRLICGENLGCGGLPAMPAWLTCSTPQSDVSVGLKNDIDFL